jgi:hypothetical protein
MPSNIDILLKNKFIPLLFYILFKADILKVSIRILALEIINEIPIDNVNF